MPKGYGHVRSPRGSGGKSEYCRETCWQPYQDCIELQGLKPQEFTSAEHAVEALKPSRKAILVGSVVLIAGVFFVTVSAGAGLLVLAPMALVVAP
ncbi:Tfp pilus assembly protein PilF [Cystobacter fuscus DSM 2262]|uniref:Tfp pilus assembly protein PilF n=1 Tax=Cystobacter fuscus (strain ATCC 25194 / DSM 2262 / NBRC 100088 / M29) TaxID=1242864 RepID=S9PP17_CYSF2|nr:Tfp pilus assembly protein PilF [Cystobacter fuscus DSM 2262]